MAGSCASSRLRADAERNRQRILAAAAEVFAARGLDASLEDVARVAGVGIGTVYRRFPSRTELVDALFEQRIDALVHAAQQAAQLGDSWKALVQFLEQAIGPQVEDRALTDLLLSNRHGTDRLLRVRARLQPLVGALVEAAQRDGHIRADVAVTDIPVLQMMLVAVGTFAHDVAPGLWRRYLALLLDGLRCRPAEASPLPMEPLDHDQLIAALDAVHCSRHSPPER